MYTKKSSKEGTFMKIAIITGASSGMGQEFVKQLDKKCLGIDEFWLIARRKDAMQSLENDTKAKLRYFSMDLTASDAYQEFNQTLEELRPNVKILVNCSGYGKTGAFMDIPLSDNTGMIALNCEALTKITYLVIPYMSRNSYIINLASAAAFLPQPNFAIYAATKAFVLSFSRALKRELRSREIWVSAVCPGPVNTPFFDIAEDAGTPFSLKKSFMAKKEKVVAQAIKESFGKREVIVHKLSMRGLRFITKLFPMSIILDIYAKFLRGVK